MIHRFPRQFSASRSRGDVDPAEQNPATLPRQPGQTQKKSEFLEVRISFDEKQAFMAACRKRGVHASSVIRAAVREYIERNKGQQSGHNASSALEKTDEGDFVMAKSQLKSARRSSWLAATGVGAICLGLGVLFALNSLAPTYAGTPSEALLQMVDKNGDGKIARSEFHNPAEDGEVYASECTIDFGVYEPEPGDWSAHFTRIDRNGDGFADLDELEQDFAAFQDAAFKKLDKDGDGTLSQGEFSPAVSFVESQAPENQECTIYARDITLPEGGDDGNAATAQGDVEKFEKEAVIAELFKVFDKNRNGVVDRGEFDMF